VATKPATVQGLAIAGAASCFRLTAATVARSADEIRPACGHISHIIPISRRSNMKCQGVIQIC
jgi:hypothetical protein